MGRTYGYFSSVLDGSERDYDPINLGELPTRYDLIKRLDGVRDQGSVPKCVSVVLTDMIRYQMQLSTKYPNFHFADSYFFDRRSDRTKSGMTPKDAFNQLVEHGVSLGILSFRSNYYAKVGSIEVAKRAIISNGPIMICLPVKSQSNDFWLGNQVTGGHAVSLVGYDQLGFMIRNSWGATYGNGGYWTLPYNDFYKAYECWTLI